MVVNPTVAYAVLLLCWLAFSSIPKALVVPIFVLFGFGVRHNTCDPLKAMVICVFRLW